jgi:hypothetical protein
MRRAQHDSTYASKVGGIIPGSLFEGQILHITEQVVLSRRVEHLGGEM